MNLNKNILKKLCRCLREYDPSIIEIVQFGSSVYAPKYAIDVDLLVFTKKKKEYGGYLDSVLELNLPYNVDVVVNTPNKPLEKRFAQQIRGCHRILYGNGEIFRNVIRNSDDPTFADSWGTLKEASADFEIAFSRKDPFRKDRRIRIAFNSLFDAARIASMVYLSIEESRWGEIKKMLPSPYRKEFQKFITTLHVKYFYDGLYPQDKAKEEFAKWHQRVEAYVKKLELEITNKERDG